MKFLRTTTATIVACLLLAPACGSQCKQKLCTPIIAKTIDYQEIKDGIILKVKQTPSQELEKIAHHSNQKLAQNNILPVTITVTNTNNASIRFSPFQKNIPFAQADKVRSALHSNKYYLVPVCIAATLALTAITGVCALVYAAFAQLYAGATLLAAYSMIIIPTGGVLLLGSGGSLLLHKKLDTDYQKMSKAICNTQCINLKPNEEFKAILLLDANKLPSNVIHIHNASDDITTFTIPIIEQNREIV